MSTCSASPTRVVLLAALASAIDGYDLQSLGLAVPLMAHDYAAPPAAFGPALTATIAGMIIGALVLTPLSERTGQRRMLITAMLLVSAGSLGAALTHGLAALFVARSIVGGGIGCAVPVAMSLVADSAPPRHRTALVTAVAVSTGAGAFVSGMAAPLLTEFGGWRAIFLVGTVLPLIAAGLLASMLPEQAFAHPVVKRNAAALAIRGLFEPRHRRATLLLWLVMPANLIVTYALTAWLPTLMTMAGWGAASAQRATGLLAIGGIAGGLLLGWLADKGWFKPALAGAYLLAAAALVFISTCPAQAWLSPLVVIGLTSYGASMMLGAATPQFYAPAIRTTGTGWASGIGRLGAMLGPLAGTVALTHGAHPAQVMRLLVWPSLLCVAGALLLPRGPGAETQPLPSRMKKGET